MIKRLTPPQQKVMELLRTGEHLCWNYRTATYQLSGGGKVANQTFRSLASARLICVVGNDTWVAVKKGDGDGV